MISSPGMKISSANPIRVADVIVLFIDRISVAGNRRGESTPEDHFSLEFPPGGRQIFQLPLWKKVQ